MHNVSFFQTKGNGINLNCRFRIRTKNDTENEIGRTNLGLEFDISVLSLFMQIANESLYRYYLFLSSLTSNFNISDYKSL